VDTAGGPAGSLLIDQGLTQVSLVFDPESQVQNSRGSYDVWDVFGEVSVPLLADQPFARELTADAAVRYSDYSTIGGATTWKTGLSWTPIDDVRFRGTYSEAVRAPNISELFEPGPGRVLPAGSIRVTRPKSTR
jgi:iron complex outermembrane recepter protein